MRSLTAALPSKHAPAVHSVKAELRHGSESESLKRKGASRGGGALFVAFYKIQSASADVVEGTCR